MPTKFSEPEPDWVPLAQAAFRYGMAGDDASEDAACRSASGGADGLAPSSRRELEELLREHSGAHGAEIDLAGAAFWFAFDDGDAYEGGQPWVILSDPVDLNIDPRREAEALFSSGFTLLSDEEVARLNRCKYAVRFATGLVWRQHILRGFERAVSSGEVSLYARVGAGNARFERLPADILSALEIVWAEGSASDAGGTSYYSIHAIHAQRGAISTVASETAAIRALARHLKTSPDITRQGALTWCNEAGFELGARAFQHRVWPNARVSAGLPGRAPPGRKRKLPS